MDNNKPNWSIAKHIFIILLISSLPILILLFILPGVDDFFAGAMIMGALGGFTVFLLPQLLIITSIIRRRKIKKGDFNPKIIPATYLGITVILVILIPFEMIFAFNAYQYINRKIHRTRTLGQMEVALSEAKENFQISDFFGEFVCPKKTQKWVRNCMTISFNLKVKNPGNYTIKAHGSQKENGDKYYLRSGLDLYLGSNETKKINLVLNNQHDFDNGYSEHYLQVRIFDTESNFSETLVTYEHPDYNWTIGTNEDHVYQYFNGHNGPLLYNESLVLYKE